MNFSVVIPIYKCSDSLYELTERITSTLTSISNNFEIIYVNDASPENDWNIITELSVTDKRIKGINLLRNFGQHYAIFTGLKYAKGKWIIVMDGDLQDQPEEIKNLYSKALENYDIVLARRMNRQDKTIKKIRSKIFFKLLYYFSGIKHDSRIANFGIYHKTVINKTLTMNNEIKILPVLLQKLNYNKTTVDVIHKKRPNGKSSYNYKKLFLHAFGVVLSILNKQNSPIQNKPNYQTKKDFSFPIESIIGDIYL